MKTFREGILGIVGGVGNMDDKLVVAHVFIQGSRE